MAELIAFSQNANSKLVDKMIEDGGLERAFRGYAMEILKSINSETILADSWPEIRVIRFRKKVSAILNSVHALCEIQKEHGSFKKLVKDCQIPPRIKNASDIDHFWCGFEYLKHRLNYFGMPFFKNTTSLLHLLLQWGFDCVKPDLVLMKVAHQERIVSSPNGEQNRKKLVRCAQEYSVKTGIRPVEMDFYLLVFGGQEWARQFLNQ